jgi:hypothetical protein
LIFKCAGATLKVSRRATLVRCKDHAMPRPLTAPEILNREFLEIRCKVLELAAAFDRLQRADGSAADDPRLARLREALAIVQDESGDRAEQVQMIFSRTYDDAWQNTLKVAPR